MNHLLESDGQENTF